MILILTKLLQFRLAMRLQCRQTLIQQHKLFNHKAFNHVPFSCKLNHLATQTQIPTANQTAPGTTSQLTEEQIEKLKRFGCCFNCKRDGHIASSCTQPTRLYLAVSAQLQKIMLLDKNASASKSGKNQPPPQLRLEKNY